MVESLRPGTDVLVRLPDTLITRNQMVLFCKPVPADIKLYLRLRAGKVWE
jgi:hypothetical protein